MKKYWIRASIISGSILMLLILFSLLHLSRHSYDEGCVFKKFTSFYKQDNLIDINNLLQIDTKENNSGITPSKIYQSSDNWKTLGSVKRDLEKLDSVNHDTYKNISLLSNLITNKLAIWDTNNLDSLNLMLEWAEEFETSDRLTNGSSLLFSSTYNYWIGFLSERLDKISKNQYSLQFDCRFRYLRMRCCQAGGGCGDQDSQLTKIVKNIIKSQWTYLLNRLWIGTSIIFKILCVILILLTGYGYICIIQKHLKK